jgi:hypothetical protein
VQPFPSNFYNYIMSNSTLLTGYGHGTPSVKVRVSALTAESYNTITKPGVYSTTRAPIPATPTEIPASGSTPQGPAVPTSASPLYSPISPTRSGGDQAPATPTLQTESPSRLPSPSSGSVQEVQSASQPPGQSNIPANSYVGTPICSPVTSKRLLANMCQAQDQGPYPSTNVGAPPSVPSAASYEPGVLPPLTIGSSVYTANSNSKYYIDINILVPGAQPITIGNAPYSLALLVIELVVGANTIPLSLPVQNTINQLIPSPPLITTEIQGYTVNSALSYVVGSQTLIPGGQAVTINAVPYSLAPSATVFLSGGSTISFIPAQTITNSHTYHRRATSDCKF